MEILPPELGGTNGHLCHTDARWMVGILMVTLMGPRKLSDSQEIAFSENILRLNSQVDHHGH